MSREIKFRFWDGHSMQSDNSGWNEDLGINEMFNALETFGNIPMQFTGLKDKNGKEIYEGDIYLAERGWMKSRGYKSNKYPNRIKVMCVVEWDMGEAAWYAKEIGPLPEFKEADENAPYHYYFTSLHGADNGIADWVEVIGNIYENENLIEK
jgi:uncharacterized phage protein (TIGR01671 family)